MSGGTGDYGGSPVAIGCKDLRMPEKTHGGRAVDRAFVDDGVGEFELFGRAVTQGRVQPEPVVITVDGLLQMHGKFIKSRYWLQ